MKITINPDSIYFGNNGIALCGDHLGNCARETGRDLDGRRIEEVTVKVLSELGGWVPSCERCGKEAKTS